MLTSAAVQPLLSNAAHHFKCHTKDTGKTVLGTQKYYSNLINVSNVPLKNK